MQLLVGKVLCGRVEATAVDVLAVVVLVVVVLVSESPSPPPHSAALRELITTWQLGSTVRSTPPICTEGLPPTHSLKCPIARSRVACRAASRRPRNVMAFAWSSKHLKADSETVTSEQSWHVVST